MSRIYALIVGHDPRQLQFEFALWTRELVAEMIARDFGVNLSLVSVGRLMKKMGLSVQRPLWRAWQQDPEAVQKWKTEEFPAIRAEVLRVASDVDVGVTADVDHRRQKGPTATAVGPL
ncbi:Winged helix-turn helix, partial [Quadrisphaera granulorum]